MRNLIVILVLAIKCLTGADAVVAGQYVTGPNSTSGAGLTRSAPVLLLSQLFRDELFARADMVDSRIHLAAYNINGRLVKGSDLDPFARQEPIISITASSLVVVTAAHIDYVTLTADARHAKAYVTLDVVASLVSVSNADVPRLIKLPKAKSISMLYQMALVGDGWLIVDPPRPVIGYATFCKIMQAEIDALERLTINHPERSGQAKVLDKLKLELSRVVSLKARP